jgi:hypothetical protein
MEQQIRKGLTGLLPSVLQDLVVAYNAPLLLLHHSTIGDDKLLYIDLIEITANYAALHDWDDVKEEFNWTKIEEDYYTNFDFPLGDISVDFGILSKKFWIMDEQRWRIEIDDKITVIIEAFQCEHPIRITTPEQRYTFPLQWNLKLEKV